MISHTTIMWIIFGHDVLHTVIPLPGIEFGHRRTIYGNNTIACDIYGNTIACNLYRSPVAVHVHIQSTLLPKQLLQARQCPIDRQTSTLSLVLVCNDWRRPSLAIDALLISQTNEWTPSIRPFVWDIPNKSSVNANLPTPSRTSQYHQHRVIWSWPQTLAVQDFTFSQPALPSIHANLPSAYISSLLAILQVVNFYNPSNQHLSS